MMTIEYQQSTSSVDDNEVSRKTWSRLLVIERKEHSARMGDY